MDTAEYEPVGVHYHAISPDDSVTSANKLTEERYWRLFEETEAVPSLDDLIPLDDVNGDAHPPWGWINRVNHILLNSKINEDRMNVLLQRALKEEDLNGEILSGLAADEGAAKVSERQMRNLLGDCYGNGIQETSVNGLPITLQSQPDFAVWNTMMLSCEGKHADKYDLEDAVRQSAGYALVHLYYWLVKRSFLVNTVYGVAVAGTSCKDMKTGDQFAVVLLSVSLPTMIGGKFPLKRYTITDTQQLKDLWTFSRRVCRLGPANRNHALGCGRGCPALLTMPYELLVKAPMPCWSMIRNGTPALVLRIENRAGWVSIKPYLDATESDLEKWREEIEHMEYPCFVKVKNSLCTHNPQNMLFRLVSTLPKMSLLMDVQDAYRVDPILTDSGMYILMADLGIGINESERFKTLDPPSLALKLSKLIDRVLECQKMHRIVHGDIHIGNLVYDEKQSIIRLIDYDEANRNSVASRTPKTDPQHRVHNRELVKDLPAYTKNQLINVFWDCWASRAVPPVLLPVREKYYGEYRDGQLPKGDTVHQIYNELCEKLKEYNDESTYKADYYIFQATRHSRLPPLFASRLGGCHFQ